jgi:hypothetical protein
MFGGGVWGRGWGATSLKRGTDETRPPNAQSCAVWGTRLEMLLYSPIGEIPR